MKNYEQRLIDLAKAFDDYKKAKRNFTEAFEKAQQEEAEAYAVPNGKSTLTILVKMGRKDEYSELREIAFQSCHQEFEAMRAAKRRLGSVRGGLMVTGQTLLRKQRENANG